MPLFQAFLTDPPPMISPSVLSLSGVLWLHAGFWCHACHGEKKERGVPTRERKKQHWGLNHHPWTLFLLGFDSRKKRIALSSPLHLFFTLSLSRSPWLDEWALSCSRFFCLWEKPRLSLSFSLLCLQAFFIVRATQKKSKEIKIGVPPSQIYFPLSSSVSDFDSD